MTVVKFCYFKNLAVLLLESWQYKRAIPRKGGHKGENLKFITIKQIWSQMNAAILYFTVLMLESNFFIIWL